MSVHITVHINSDNDIHYGHVAEKYLWWLRLSGIEVFLRHRGHTRLIREALDELDRTLPEDPDMTPALMPIPKGAAETLLGDTLDDETPFG